MTRRRVTDEQYGQLQRRLGEVARRVDEGTVALDPAMSALQRIVNGEFTTAADDTEWFTFTTTGKSLNELWEANRGLFWGDEGRWWKNEKFAKAKAKPKQIKLRLSELPDSLNKTYGEQCALLGNDEQNPNTREVVDGMIQHYQQTGKKIFANCWVRCLDVSSHGDRVDVGFNEGRVDVSYWHDSNRYSDIGLAARKS